MKTREYYTKEYLYEPGDMETGLRFETNHPEGFVYGCMFQKEWKGEAEWRIKDTFKQVEIQFESVSEEAAEYILQECHKILRGDFSIWRINCVIPQPNMITLELVLKDEETESQNQELIDELLAQALQVTIDIHGDDTQVEGDFVGLNLKCQDAHNPEDISYLSVHACHNSRAECAWEEERAHIRIEQTVGDRRYERSITIRWKNKKRKRMIAEIKETY